MKLGPTVNQIVCHFVCATNFFGNLAKKKCSLECPLSKKLYSQELVGEGLGGYTYSRDRGICLGNFIYLVRRRRVLRRLNGFNIPEYAIKLAG